MQQPAKPAHEQLTQYRDQLANDLLRVEQSVSLLRSHTHGLPFSKAGKPNSHPATSGPARPPPPPTHAVTAVSCMLLSWSLTSHFITQIMDMESNYFNAEHTQTGNVLKVCDTEGLP